MSNFARNWSAAIAAMPLERRFGVPRATERIRPVLDAIAEVWARHPDLRLGQLLVHAAGNRDVFQIEEDELLRGLAEFDEEDARRRG